MIDVVEPFEVESWFSNVESVRATFLSGRGGGRVMSLYCCGSFFFTSIIFFSDGEMLSCGTVVSWLSLLMLSFLLLLQQRVI